MASILRAVSLKVSPFNIELLEELILTTSADKRLAANSKDVLVLVEGSKNKVTIVLPLKAGTFFIGLLDISLKEVAVSKM
jgi:hypothetical protein